MAIFDTLGNIGGKIAEGAKTVGGKVSSGFETFKNRLGGTASNVPSQYQFDNLGTSTGTVPSQYQFNNLGGTLYDGYDLGGQNAGKNTLPTGVESKPNESFMKALLQQSNTSNGGGGSVATTPQFKVTPSMVNYSEYMGLSPETQRYLYGGR